MSLPWCARPPGRRSVLVGLLLLVCLAGQRWQDVAAEGTKAIEVPIKTPDFAVEGDEAYVCVAVHLPAEPHRLVGVTPDADMGVVHHILLYGEDRAGGWWAMVAMSVGEQLKGLPDSE